MDTFEEELEIPCGGTATTSDKIVTVGCKGVYAAGCAAIGFSVASGGELCATTLAPSQSLSLNSDERSYRVMLLATQSTSVRVRVNHLPRDKAKAKEKEAEPPIRIRETKTSCFNELQRIVQSELRPSGRFQISEISTDFGTLKVFEKRQEWLDWQDFWSGSEWTRAIKKRGPIVLWIQNATSLFENDRWDDLMIYVYKESCLEIAKKVAQSYHLKPGGPNVTILKEF